MYAKAPVKIKSQDVDLYLIYFILSSNLICPCDIEKYTISYELTAFYIIWYL